MGRSLSGENASNAVLISVFLLEREYRRRAETNRLFEQLQLPIVAAQLTD